METLRILLLVASVVLGVLAIYAVGARLEYMRRICVILMFLEMTIIIILHVFGGL